MVYYVTYIDRTAKVLITVYNRNGSSFLDEFFRGIAKDLGHDTYLYNSFSFDEHAYLHLQHADYLRICTVRDPYARYMSSLKVVAHTNTDNKNKNIAISDVLEHLYKACGNLTFNNNHSTPHILPILLLSKVSECSIMVIDEAIRELDEVYGVSIAKYNTRGPWRQSNKPQEFNDSIHILDEVLRRLNLTKQDVENMLITDQQIFQNLRTYTHFNIAETVYNVFEHGKIESWHTGCLLSRYVYPTLSSDLQRDIGAICINIIEKQSVYYTGLYTRMSLTVIHPTDNQLQAAISSMEKL